MSNARPVEKFALIPQSQYDHMLKGSFRRVGGAGPSLTPDPFQSTVNADGDDDKSPTTSPPPPPPGEPVRYVDEIDRQASSEPRWVDVWQSI